jgi:hypothetical protein
LVTIRFDGLGVETREVEQLLDEVAHAARLLQQRLLHLVARRVGELALPVDERLDEPDHARDGRAQLVGRERDEVRLELVGALERGPGLALLAKSRAWSSASPVSAPRVRSRRSSSVPKNGAYGVVQTISSPVGISIRTTGSSGSSHPGSRSPRSGSMP